jgi:hypothetical protein
MFALAKVMYNGAKKYEKDNWRGLTLEDHLNHALAHIYAHLAGDAQDDHLEHAFCRLMMAVGVQHNEQPDPNKHYTTSPYTGSWQGTNSVPPEG